MGCPLCDRAIKLGYSKKGKTYATCNSCGLQLFLRSDRAEQRLAEILAKGVDGDGDH